MSAALITLVFTLVSVAGSVCAVDADGDGVCDSDGSDNCTEKFNPGQRDDDEDGYGNLCDWDINNDCVAGAPDIALVFSRPLDAAPWNPKSDGAYDITEDDVVGAPDIAQIFAHPLEPPGPSSRACADCSAAIGTGVCP
jgi:hypothetical protein